MQYPPLFAMFFFFNDTATTEIYTLSLHDALPISRPIPPRRELPRRRAARCRRRCPRPRPTPGRPTMQRRLRGSGRSEEHTSELQSRQYLVCRLLLEKKKKYKQLPSIVLTQRDSLP